MPSKRSRRRRQSRQSGDERWWEGMPRGVEHNGVRAGRGGAVFSQPMRERGLCFVRVQCERMAVLGPVWYRMKRFFEVTSFPLYNRARAATPACTHVGSLSLSKSMYAPQAPKHSPKRKHAKRPTTSQPAPISLIPCHTHTPQKQPTQLRPATTIHLSHIQGSETPRSVSLKWHNKCSS